LFRVRTGTRRCLFFTSAFSVSSVANVPISWLFLLLQSDVGADMSGSFEFEGPDITYGKKNEDEGRDMKRTHDSEDRAVAVAGVQHPAHNQIENDAAHCAAKAHQTGDRTNHAAREKVRGQNHHQR